MTELKQSLLGKYFFELLPRIIAGCYRKYSFSIKTVYTCRVFIKSTNAAAYPGSFSNLSRPYINSFDTIYSVFIITLSITRMSMAPLNSLQHLYCSASCRYFPQLMYIFSLRGYLVRQAIIFNLIALLPISHQQRCFSLLLTPELHSSLGNCLIATQFSCVLIESN